MRPSLAPLLVGLAGAPAYAGDVPAPQPLMDLSKMEEVLPMDPTLRPVVTVAIARVAGLGLPLQLVGGEKPGQVRFEGVPVERSSDVVEAVGGTRWMNGNACVAFVVTPEKEDATQWTMGAECGPATEIYPMLTGQ